MNSRNTHPAAETLMWYDHPASAWTGALPLGNGRLGAMVFGGVPTERVQINEDTLYSGEPGQRDLSLDVTERFDEVVDLLRHGRYREADELVTQHWLGRSWPCYQPMVDLSIDFGPSGAGREPVESYVRRLDLDSAITEVEYMRAGRPIRREAFVSHPDDVLVYHVAGDLAHCVLRITSAHPISSLGAGDTLWARGNAPGLVLRRTMEWIEEHGDAWKYPELFDESGRRKELAKQVLYGDEIDGLGMEFAVAMRVSVDGGTVAATDAGIEVRGSRGLTFILSAATSFAGHRKSPSREGKDPEAACRATLEAVTTTDYRVLRERHVADHRALFRRVQLHLGEADAPQANLPTDQRLAQFANGNDPEFAALYYQFGRYLTIAGSRVGTEPLNLQGIWNQDVIPPWASAYTMNINLQMNYWPTEGANLSECTEPLSRLVRELAEDGRRVAREMYHRRGWVAHHNTTIWRGAQPVDNIAQTSFWLMSSGWLCRHLWDHYLHTCDTAFLRDIAYPLVRGAAEFYLDWLVEDDAGMLVTPVSTSPENEFYYTDESGKRIVASVSMGGTMDMAIIRDCFSICRAAAGLLGVGKDDLDVEIASAMPRLLPYQVAEDGQLKEWSHDHPSTEAEHRHLSHLYGAYPADQIQEPAPGESSMIWDAVGRTLDVRGDHPPRSGGWTAAWKVCLWARRRDGARAYSILSDLLRPESSFESLLCGRGEIYQIDGNLGGTAGIQELLVQSSWRPGEDAGGGDAAKGDAEAGAAKAGAANRPDALPVIDLLPALPPTWNDGSYCGVRVRGGFELSFGWENGALSWLTVTSLAGNACEVRHQGRSAYLSFRRAGETVALDRHLTTVSDAQS